MKKNLITAVGAAVLPPITTGVCLSAFSSQIVAYGLAMIFSFALLSILYYFADLFFDELRKYKGQWVEEMHDIENNLKLIGIGNIQYDKKTKQYTFSGKTYKKNRDHCIEIFDWDAKYLVSTRDNVLEYICFVENPREDSIGILRFTGKDAASGNIETTNGQKYAHNAYRITTRMIEETNVGSPRPVNILRKGHLNLEEYPKFATNYANTRYALD
ncbi:MAG: hypothetical protein LBR74_00550 [Eubacterium sp.]|jgi:hypothetical protein|nr:hypothetical protein [Eubacterium sp.]